MVDRIKRLIDGKQVGILGFGIEGQSTLRFLRKHFGNIHIIIADRDKNIASRFPTELADRNIQWFTGPGYLEEAFQADLLFKGPGIELPEDLLLKYKRARVVSQTGLMLSEYREQIIGITGTKGKSTTSSLIHHILNMAGKHNILIGNIGIAPFDSLGEVEQGTLIVYELSANQLEGISISPHISILLNLFPEHLDRYTSLEHYYRSKWNIFLYQQKGDYLILEEDIPANVLPENRGEMKSQLLKYGRSPHKSEGAFLEKGNVVIHLDGEEKKCCTLPDDLHLKGQHNKLNMLAAILACHVCDVSYGRIMEGIRTFHGLEHRLEYVGKFRGIDFYNDSIATIPEAAIEAVKTIQNISTIILGGYDRGLDYSRFIEFLMGTGIRNFIFMGEAGERMHQLAIQHKKGDKNLFQAKDFEDAFTIIPEVTPQGAACLLSPAAASYDSFKNFEERGRVFKQIARSL